MQVKRLNIDGKPLAYKEEVTTHTGNTAIHVTSADKTRWNNNFNPIYYSENTSSQIASIAANDIQLNASNGSVYISSDYGTSFTVGPTNVSYGSLFCVGPDGVWLGTSENRVEVLKNDLMRRRIYDL